MLHKKAFKSFRYETHVTWNEARKGVIFADGKPSVEISSPPEFKGKAGLWSPEDLFVSALNTCIMLTFLAFAERKGLDLKGYESSAEALLEYKDGNYRFTEATIRPRVEVKSQDEFELARRVMEQAHANCFLSNSITASVKINPEFRIL
jgi:peroxiredoxin-like protein